MTFDFEALGATWLEEIEASLDHVVLAPGDRAYGLAFWLLYAVEGGVISPPCVGLGTERDWESIHRGEPVDAGFGSWRWNPADWPRGMFTPRPTPRIDTAYRRLAEAACGGLVGLQERGRPANDAERRVWNEAWAASTTMLVGVARELTRRADARTGPFARLAITDDFVAVVCDPSLGREGEELLLRCVDAPLAARLFPNVAR